jgi:hypothetical protein
VHGFGAAQRKATGIHERLQLAIPMQSPATGRPEYENDRQDYADESSEQFIATATLVGGGSICCGDGQRSVPTDS